MKFWILLACATVFGPWNMMANCTKRGEMMRSECRFVAVLCMVVFFVSGCVALRHDIIPQNGKGPHGGAWVLVDRRVPEYIEFVAVHAGPAWTFQVYSYDKNLTQNSMCCTGFLKIELPDGSTLESCLSTTTPFFWSRGSGHLESRMELKTAKEFSAEVTLCRGRLREHLNFKYPY